MSPDPTPPTSPAAVSAPLRPVEEIERDLADIRRTRELATTSPRVAAAIRERLVADVPSLLACLRAAEETLAAVGALCDEADALPDLRRNFDGSVSPGIVTTDKIRAALAEGASR